MYIYRKIIVIALVWIGGWSSVHAYVTEEGKERLLTLRNLSLEELQKIKISLDDVFDVFDGLVSTQKVKLASGLQRNTAMAPSVTTVITAQDIEVSGARTLEEVLRMVPGMHINHVGNFTPLYTLRGMYSTLNAEILFLLNGIPINSMLTGNRGIWGDVVPALEQIARIEIIRGPGSALYGADAYAGVINLMTKTAREVNGTDLGIREGSYNTSTQWISHGSSYGPLEIAMSVYHQHTKGHSPWIPRDAQTNFDQSPGARKIPAYQTASRSPGKANLQEERLTSSLDIDYKEWQMRMYYQGTQDRGPGVQYLIVDPLGLGGTQRYGMDIKWSKARFMEHWDLEAYSTYQQLTDEGDFWRNPPGSFVPPHPFIAVGGVYPEGVREQYEYLTSRWLLGLNGSYSGFARHQVHMGIGYTFNDLDPHIWSNRGKDALGNLLPLNSPLVNLSDSPYMNYPHVDRKNWQVFIQDTWGIASGWEVTTGIRYDSYFEQHRQWDTVNPRLALVWQPVPQLVTKLLYGRAFRAPTFRELYLPIGVIVGNPSLGPEKLSTYELVFEYQAQKNLNFTLNTFLYYAHNKIITAPFKEGMNRFKNVAAWKGKGLELEARWKVSSNSSFLFNYSHTDNDETGLDTLVHDLGNYPHHMAYLRIDWMLLPGGFVDFQAKRVMNQERLVVVSRPPVRDNTTIDLTLRYKNVKKKDWSVAIGVRNLLDSDIEEPSTPNAAITYDFLMPGRNWFAEIRYHF